MKQLLKLCILAILLFGNSCKNAPKLVDNTASSTNTSLSALQYFNFKNKNETIISAHRGGKGYKGFPENCLETIEYLYKKGISTFEIDLAETRDGEIILMHDDRLNRTSSGNGYARNYKSEKIKDFVLKDDFGTFTKYKIPFFKDVMKWAKDKEVYFMLDFKAPIEYKKVIDILENTQTKDKCVLISYSITQTKKLQQLAPNMMQSVSIRNERELQMMLDTDLPTKNMIAFTGTRKPKKELYYKIHKHNIMCILGTLGNLDKQAKSKNDKTYSEFVKIGADVLATDRPLEAFNAIQ